VLKLFGGLMRRLPQDRFEVYAYALEAGSDAVTELLRRDLDAVRTEIGPLAVMAQSIRDDACDALVYVDIGMHPRTAALSAMRLAPFQAMLWGHPVTSGVDTMDAFFSSALMEPEDGERHYRERLLPLPGLGCWYDPGALPLQPAQAAADPSAPIRIVCAQNGLKLLPEQDAVFARVLAAVPEAELVLLCGLHAGIEANLLARMRPAFAAHGVDLDRRVRVVGHVDESTFLRELWQADLVLDALAWSGGVTAFETFWGDVPILTLPGAFMRGRHTFAMLRLMDLPELVAADVDDLVAKAVAPMQYIYTMIGVSKIVPPKRQIIKDISLSFLPGRQDRPAGPERRRQVDGAAHHGRRGHRLHRRGAPAARHQDRLPGTGAKLDPEQDRAPGSRRRGRDHEARRRELDEVYAAYAEEGADFDKLAQGTGAPGGILAAGDAHALEQQLEVAADALRLPPWDAIIGKLSGGEKRRVALCRLLLSRSPTCCCSTNPPTISMPNRWNGWNSSSRASRAPWSPSPMTATSSTTPPSGSSNSTAAAAFRGRATTPTG
jgi:hypothetical protein